MARSWQTARKNSFLEHEEEYVARFLAVAGEKNAINFEEFKQVSGCKNEVFASKFFDAMSARQSGDITLREYLEALQKLRSENVHERIQFLFEIFDLEGDGFISGEELKIVLQASVEEEGGEMTEEESARLVNALMQLFGADQASSVSFAQFESVVLTYPDLLTVISFGHVGLRSPEPKPPKKSHRRARKFASWVMNNPQLLFTYTLIIVALLGCFLWRFLKFAGDCDEVDMDMKDPLTGYTRHDVVHVVEDYKGSSISHVDSRYMVFSRAMAEEDPVECRHARKRALLGWALPVAKGCGQAMNVTFLLILFPVSRNLMAALRDSCFKQFFFFNGTIQFHKFDPSCPLREIATKSLCRFLGFIGFWLAWAHTLCHLKCMTRWKDPENFKFWSWSFPEDRHVEHMEGVLRDANGTAVRDGVDRLVFNDDMQGDIPRMFFNDGEQTTLDDILQLPTFVTGVILAAVYTIAALFAFDYPRKLLIFKEPADSQNCGFIRRRLAAIGRFLNDFDNFWYSHHLFTIFYAALLLHPLSHSTDEKYERGRRDSCLWVIVPVLIYMTEKVVRVTRGISKTEIISVEQLDGDVVGLKLECPRTFKYLPGQYVFVRCPQISQFEWHPFTLTSCPGDSHLGVHIRNAGDWTGALHALVAKHVKEREDQIARNSPTSTMRRRKRYCSGVGGDSKEAENFNFTISVDGPFGAPAQDHTDYEVMILIGAGIGVTPLASVLADLLESLEENSCATCGSDSETVMRRRVQKVYFYWTVKSSAEATWFNHLLHAISQQDQDELLEINVNITGVKEAKDLRTMLLSLAQYESENVADSFSRTVTRFGRIKWSEVFEKVKCEFPDEPEVGVFYCGPRSLGNDISKMCRQNSSESTKFAFMTESFG